MLRELLAHFNLFSAVLFAGLIPFPSSLSGVLWYLFVCMANLVAFVNWFERTIMHDVNLETGILKDSEPPQTA